MLRKYRRVKIRGTGLGTHHTDKTSFVFFPIQITMGVHVKIVLPVRPVPEKIDMNREYIRVFFFFFFARFYVDV